MNNTAATMNPSNDTSNARDFRGSKYESGLDVAEIARRFRADAKAAKLGVKLSVRTERYAGGCSINVTIKSLPNFRVVNPERVIADMENPHGFNRESLLTTEGQALIEKIEGLLNAYNFDKSDSMVDYFHVNFYGRVTFDGALLNAEREEIREEYAANKAA